MEHLEVKEIECYDAELVAIGFLKPEVLSYSTQKLSMKMQLLSWSTYPRDVVYGKPVD